METKTPAFSGNRPSTLLTHTNLAIFFVAVSLLLVIFFGQGEYSSYLEASANLDTALAQEKTVSANLDTLNDIQRKTDAKTGDSQVHSDLIRYADSLREDAIIRSIFKRDPNIIISSVSIAPGQTLPSGLSIADISLSLTAKDVTNLSRFLDYLTSPSNQKRYIIKSLSFPFDMQKNTNIAVSLVLGMYYLNEK